jgi:hypothetical protein
MLTEYVRDHSFTIAWFGLMTFVWLGWSQEDPKPWMRPILGIGSVLGLGLSIWFGILTYRGWSGATALEGRYPWMGVLVVVEFALAGIGVLVLARRKQQRWSAWWVALVVALHFLPLGILLQDGTVVALGVAQAIALVALVPLLRRAEYRTSRVAGPVMGFSLLGYAVVSAVVFLLVR